MFFAVKIVMWVLQSGACEDIKATFFHYSRTRSQKVALELIDGFKGYLTTDAYAAYSNMHLEDVKNNFCWSHLRRYYIDSIPLDSSGKEIPGSKGAEGREYINLLFNLESEMSDLPYNERKVKRQEASRALLDALKYLIIYANHIYVLLQQQDVHGFLLIHQTEQEQMLYFILW